MQIQTLVPLVIMTRAKVMTMSGVATLSMWWAFKGPQQILEGTKNVQIKLDGQNWM